MAEISLFMVIFTIFGLVFLATGRYEGGFEFVSAGIISAIMFLLCRIYWRQGVFLRGDLEELIIKKRGKITERRNFLSKTRIEGKIGDIEIIANLDKPLISGQQTPHYHSGVHDNIYERCDLPGCILCKSEIILRRKSDGAERVVYGGTWLGKEFERRIKRALAEFANP